MQHLLAHYLLENRSHTHTRLTHIPPMWDSVTWRNARWADEDRLRMIADLSHRTVSPYSVPNTIAPGLAPTMAHIMHTIRTIDPNHDD